MSVLNEQSQQAVTKGNLAHLVTLNEDGSPQISLKLTEIGLECYLIVHGRARITEGGGPELLQRLARVYLGPDVKFPPFDNPPAGHIIRITAERVGGIGPW